ncbi:unnamed protein product, partial [Adineta ricciae]
GSPVLLHSKQSGDYLNSWSSFNYALVHIISLSCESGFPGNPSNNFLDNTTQVNRTVTPWLLFNVIDLGEDRTLIIK